MMVLVGVVIVIVGVLGGFMMHHGHLGVLMQPSEFVIIGGAALGSLLVMSSPAILKALWRDVKRACLGGRHTRQGALDQLATLFLLFRAAQVGGTQVLDAHVENPQESDILKTCPSLLKNHHVLEMLCDTLKIIATDKASPGQVQSLTDLSVQAHEDETSIPVTLLSRVADSLPGLGIVAAVLGIVVTMQSIGGDPSVIGQQVAVALVGTLLGVLLCYGFVGPLTVRVEMSHYDTRDILKSVQACLLAYAEGLPATMCVEFGRRALPSAVRPSFKDLEDRCRDALRNGPKGLTVAA